MQLLGLVLIGGFHYREKFGRRGDPKGRAVLRPGEWELKSLNPLRSALAPSSR
jgi:hypothetical protein